MYMIITTFVHQPWRVVRSLFLHGSSHTCIPSWTHGCFVGRLFIITVVSHWPDGWCVFHCITILATGSHNDLLHCMIVVYQKRTHARQPSTKCCVFLDGISMSCLCSTTRRDMQCTDNSAHHRDIIEVGIVNGNTHAWMCTLLTLPNCTIVNAFVDLFFFCVDPFILLVVVVISLQFDYVCALGNSHKGYDVFDCTT